MRGSARSGRTDAVAKQGAASCSTAMTSRCTLQQGCLVIEFLGSESGITIVPETRDTGYARVDALAPLMSGNPLLNMVLTVDHCAVPDVIRLLNILGNEPILSACRSPPVLRVRRVVVSICHCKQAERSALGARFWALQRRDMITKHRCERSALAVGPD